MDCPWDRLWLFRRPIHLSHRSTLFNNAMHWVTVEAVDDATIKVYDSTNCRPNLSVQVQASSMMQTAKKQISFQLEKMQVQKGAGDCGLFAIAYVTELCHGNCPTSYRYDIELPFDSYNQSILLVVAMTLDCSYITGMTSHVYAHTF